MNPEYVDFLLTLGGGLQPGAVRPPPQRLRIPVSFLEPLNPTARLTDGAIQASAVSVHVPLAGTTVQITLGITGEGWQARARRSADPERGGMPNHIKEPAMPSGLQAIASKDPNRYDNPYERVYLAEDAELGFIHVKCMGFADQAPRNCRITSELTPHLTLSVHLPEDRLSEWRENTVAARDVAKTFFH